METTWKLIETCGLSIILYAPDTWNNNKEHTNELNKILDNIIKRTMQTPTSTPRETLYMETGMLDIEHAAQKKQLLMKHSIQDNASDLMNIANTKGGWENLENRLNIETQDYTKSKKAFKTHITERINIKFKESIEEKGKNKSKVKHLKQGQSEWIPW